MRPLRRGICALAAAALTLAGLGITGTPAEAATRLRCGTVITQDTTLSANVGPCAGDGLIIGADGITLNLGRYTVTGKNGAAETVGVRFRNVTGSKVQGGTITGFDAGVAVVGGSGNTVASITARDNINDNTGAQTATTACAYGDGIVVENSDTNTITGNRVVHNGPFSGISLILDSDNNSVLGNTVLDSNVPNVSGGDRTGSCGAPFSRRIQDIGIRIEGPGADGNLVRSNRVTNSAIGGITVHGYVYCPPTGDPLVCGPSQDPNTGNLIQYNYVSDTGKDVYAQDALDDGIAVLRQGPATIVGVSQGNTIDQNTVVNSYRHGIFLGNPACGTVANTNPPVTRCQPLPYTGNTVTGNTVHYSFVDGINVPRGSVNNTLSTNEAKFSGEHDGHDVNANCDNNLWSDNTFDWVNQACVSPTAGVR
ncbi:MAG: right-handed parallel beta-helix repeat-containing protein [Actinobacteria bacterium]|nr:right-handed parallel beta-helix repeat-containing protein [Actinomycetota bacterium]